MSDFVGGCLFVLMMALIGLVVTLAIMLAGSVWVPGGVLMAIVFITGTAAGLDWFFS